MKEDFDYRTLAAVYDRGCLVPFIGSGMSRPVCADWTQFIERLESQAGIDKGPVTAGSQTQRALLALHGLRREGRDIGGAVRAAVYLDTAPETPTHSQPLASVFWPLVCSTNYDDVYLRATLSKRRVVPRILGRSEADCRHILKHLSLPDGEVLWALQGFLAPRSTHVQDALGTDFDAGRLEEELVVGHAEYRRAAHRAPHFRRCFAELFRTRSLLFLGSGLEEAYFRALFDEIIELSGPPVRPHFAIVEEGTLDPGFMREQYHIVCHTYAKGQHDDVSRTLEEFSTFLLGERARPTGWRFRVNSSARVRKDDTDPHFEVIRAGLPKPHDISDHEVVAVSCGRGDATTSGSSRSRRGVPLLGGQAAGLAGGLPNPDFAWVNDWVVKWENQPRGYGIVARELIDTGGSSRDRRSPEAIRKAFRAFLDVAASNNVSVAHVQLLAAGPLRAFKPWVSLVQMARAYGQWVRDGSLTTRTRETRVAVYVVDPGVMALLSGGHLDLVEQLEDTPLRISVEIIDAAEHADAYHLVVDPTTPIGSLSVRRVSRTAEALRSSGSDA